MIAILSATLVGLGIGFGAVLGLSDEALDMVLFCVTLTASFTGFSLLLDEIDKRRHKGLRQADLRHYDMARVHHG